LPGAGPILKMVDARLTQRASLSRFGETLRQSVSAIACGQIVSVEPGDSSMPSPAASAATVGKALRRFRSNRRGSVAVEFALVAPLFIALLFAIIETAIVFMAGQVLQSVATEAARTILTGQAQNAGYTQAQFQNNVVCPLIPALFTCTNLYIDVESSSAFTGFTLNNEVVSGVFQTTNMQYNPGGPGDVVVVRLFYQWPLFVTGFGYNITNLANGNRELTATVAFRNEP
jgi:Flp pilus assembly protein TadG